LTREVKGLPRVERILYWMRERDSIRRKRALELPPPWTDDEILRTYRFCNVRRMDDRVSDWLYRNWYRPFRDHQNLLAAVCLARFINLPEALGRVGFPVRWEPGRIKEALSAGDRVFNGAYMIRCDRGLDKISYVVDRCLGPLLQDRPVVHPESMERTWQELTPRYGFGSFMAGQVVADLRWALPGAWKDRRFWAPHGPGSLRGLNRLADRPPEDRTATRYWQEEFARFQEQVYAALSADLTKRLEAIDYQNVLCEWDKYERALWGQGRPKQLYRGTRP